MMLLLLLRLRGHLLLGEILGPGLLGRGRCTLLHKTLLLPGILLRRAERVASLLYLRSQRLRLLRRSPGI